MIALCSKCAKNYEAGSEEQANESDRLCFACRNIQEKDTIPFNELETYNDSNSFVWMGLLYESKDLLDIEKFLKEEKFLSPTAKIINVLRIVENIKDKESRVDMLFVTEPTVLNPIARITIKDLKWTSDFIVNARKDYKVPAKPMLQLLTGNCNDGNSFLILDRAMRVAKKNKMDWETIKKEATSSDYEHLIKIINKYFDCDVKDKKDFVK